MRMKHNVFISNSGVYLKNNAYKSIVASIFNSPNLLQNLMQGLTASIRRNINYIGYARKVINHNNQISLCEEKRFKHNFLKISNNGVVVFINPKINFGQRKVKINLIDLVENPTIRF